MRGIVKAWNAFQFELFVAFLCLISGVPLAFRVTPPPNSIATALPTWTLFIWGLLMSLGGLCTVTGIFWRHVNEQQFLTGLYVEQGGLYMLGACSSVLAVSIVYYAGSVGFLSAGIFGVLALACMSRIWTIHKEAKIVREHGGT